MIKTEDDCPFEDYELDVFRDLMINIYPSLQGIVELNNIGRIILPQRPLGIQQLSCGNYTGGVAEVVVLHNDAIAYTTTCVFNVNNHARKIYYLLQYMLLHKPRVIIPSLEFVYI